MQIARAEVSFASQRIAYQRQETSLSLRAWVGPRRPDFEGRGVAGAARSPLHSLPVDSVSLSDQAKSCQCERAKDDAELDLSPEESVKLALIRRILEKLTGRDFKLLRPKDLKPQDGDAGAKVSEAIQQAEQRVRSQTAPGRAGFGLEVDYEETHLEVEQTSFSASGTIQTKDGQTISFDVDVSMSRAFAERHEVHIRAGDAALKDPLVINFDGLAAELTKTKFSFDLDTDGTVDQISFVGPGSGFLAIDANDDGTINDGSELFGPRSGDGLRELAAFDIDQNQWIDEADPAYQLLRVWSKDGSGNDRLLTLSQASVGAIYLRAAATQFDLRNDQNLLDGKVLSTGIYVREDGQVGTVQQIDLAA